MDFFGCALLAFGPPLALFTFTVSVEPIRIIILIASAFFWLISLLLSSILWYAVVPLQKHLAFGLVFSVLFQEGFRSVIHALAIVIIELNFLANYDSLRFLLLIFLELVNIEINVKSSFFKNLKFSTKKVF